jgi:hypothetical protein
VQSPALSSEAPLPAAERAKDSANSNKEAEESKSWAHIYDEDDSSVMKPRHVQEHWPRAPSPWQTGQLGTASSQNFRYSSSRPRVIRPTAVSTQPSGPPPMFSAGYYGGPRHMRPSHPSSMAFLPRLAQRMRPTHYCGNGSDEPEKEVMVLLTNRKDETRRILERRVVLSSLLIFSGIIILCFSRAPRIALTASNQPPPFKQEFLILLRRRQWWVLRQ